MFVRQKFMEQSIFSIYNVHKKAVFFYSEFSLKEYTIAFSNFIYMLSVTHFPTLLLTQYGISNAVLNGVWEDMSNGKLQSCGDHERN